MQRFADDRVTPSWRQRPKPIGVEYSYRLAGDVLDIITPRRTESVSLATVAQVRFIYAPSNISSKGFRTQLRLQSGRTLGFGNLSWRSLTDIDHDDAGYHRFVTALCAAVTSANPRVVFLAGKPFPLWIAVAAVGASSLLMLAGFTTYAFVQGTKGAAALGVLLLLASIWQVWPMIARNRPRALAQGEVPDDLVPGRAAY